MIILFNFYNAKYDYYNNDLQQHRLGGVACEVNDTKWWYKGGKFHREDGPAIEYYYGAKFYYLNGKEYPEKEYWSVVRFGVFV